MNEYAKLFMGGNRIGRSFLYKQMLDDVVREMMTVKKENTMKYVWFNQDNDGRDELLGNGVNLGTFFNISCNFVLIENTTVIDESCSWGTAAKWMKEGATPVSDLATLPPELHYPTEAELLDNKKNIAWRDLTGREQVVMKKASVREGAVVFVGSASMADNLLTEPRWDSFGGVYRVIPKWGTLTPKQAKAVVIDKLGFHVKEQQ